MIYKGYRIEAEVKRAEIWTLADDGELQAYSHDCPYHDDDPIVYEVVNPEGETVGSGHELDGVKKYIDLLVLGAPV
ncbi:hypothetical protein [Streptomyces sp. bgisy034]|uniref:hypothetical protein n=1 Tax=Streptomyces sp. bgisy034 TaxID=3413774 RepID=UPI003EB7246B